MGELLAAFDAKRFLRVKPKIDVKLEKDTAGVDTEESLALPRKSWEFYSPLGIGVETENENSLVSEYQRVAQALASSFSLEYRMPCYCSTYLKRQLGMRRALPFSDQLIKEIQSCIQKVFISYVVLPPPTFPTVEVGGYRCPVKELKTEGFLRQLGPMFSYLTAWNYMRERHKRDEEIMPKILIDHFESKQTIAWRELLTWVKPTVYLRGDECNESICVADLLAFLTDAKLYSQPDWDKRKLEPSNLARIWEDYEFDVEVRYLDHYTLTKYKWDSEDKINATSFLARPIVFAIFDDVSRKAPLQDSDLASITDVAMPARIPKKSPEDRQRLEPYIACLTKANRNRGCVKFYDPQIDSSIVRDGDTLIYMGERSKAICQVFQDGFKVKVKRAVDARREMGI